MTFIPLALYTVDGDFVGWAIKGEHKLQSTNIYAENEQDALNVQLDRLNIDIALKTHWPNPQDPAVVALLSDESFHPIEMVDVEVIDEDHSYLVYKKIARPSLEAEQLGQAWVDSDEVDEEASVVVYKTVKAPARPTDQMLRIKTACEQVARQRAGLLS